MLWDSQKKKNKTEQKPKIKYDTSEFIYKIEADSQTENKFMVTKGERWGGVNQELGINKYTLTYKMHKQQVPTV